MAPFLPNTKGQTEALRKNATPTLKSLNKLSVVFHFSFFFFILFYTFFFLFNFILAITIIFNFFFWKVLPDTNSIRHE